MTSNLQRIYVGYRAKEKNARALLEQMNWFCRTADFDPKTGLALPQALSAFLKKVSQPVNNNVIHDRLWRIAEHTRSSVERLFRSLNESPRREQALLAVHSVRELDANSFIKLSNRPGRTIREKLAGKPYMQAVHRFQSIDLPENRLLKAFVRRLAELLELRREFLGHEDELLPTIQSWLRSEEVQVIGNWDNLPPNNTLLSHRDYRRVWDAWRWLQTLDDDLAGDFSQLEARNKTMRLWMQSAQIWSYGKHLFAEMPLIFDYEKFEILPWSSKPPLFNASRQNILRRSQRYAITDPVCIDFTSLRPRYACGDAQFAQSLPDTFLWQKWKRDDESVDIELFHSDAVWLHPQSTTISAPNLFFAKDNTSEICDRAARAFGSHLRDTFKHDTLIWLVPDYLNDFELEVIRRNINARLPNSEPLPRSVAAVISQIDYSRVHDNFTVLVLDSAGGQTCITKLIAKFDMDLKKILPETGGFYWERCPSVVISRTDREELGISGHDINTVDANEQWHDPTPAIKPKFFDASLLMSDPRIGYFTFCFNLIESPVVGGISLHALQQRAGDIPIWRNQIPELSIKVMKDGIRQRFHLVSRGTTVKPIRGKSVSININEAFTLPSGKPFYQFPLFIGDAGDDLGFSARLSSPAFPLKSDVVCDLNLTFEYGADEPYKLAFAPRDKSFPPVRATWQPTVGTIVDDAPFPEYPPPLIWTDLQNWTDAQGNQLDMLKWLIESLHRLYELIPVRSAITISTNWRQKTDSSNERYWFAFAESEGGENCYCNTNNFIIPPSADPNNTFPRGVKLYCSKRTTQSGISAFDISPDKNTPISFDSKQRIISFRARSLINRMSLIWGDARSLDDLTCPAQFKKDLIEIISALLGCLPSEVIDKKFMTLLACMHKDSPAEGVQWITKQIADRSIRNKQAVGFALGDVSAQWQKYVLSELVARPTSDALRVLTYAVWREKNIISKFSFSELKTILNSLSIMLVEIKACPPQKGEKDKSTVREWARASAEPLELLLGLLRTRASSNPDIKMLLQPHQRITTELAKQVERVTDIVLQSNVHLFSRVQLNIQKPEGDRTPNLLYALRLYLTGDDGANAIHISSVSDED